MENYYQTITTAIKDASKFCENNPIHCSDCPFSYKFAKRTKCLITDLEEDVYVKEVVAATKN